MSIQAKRLYSDKIDIVIPKLIVKNFLQATPYFVISETKIVQKNLKFVVG